MNKWRLINELITFFTGCIHHPALFLKFLAIILYRDLIPIQLLISVLLLILTMATVLKPGTAPATSWRPLPTAHPFST